MVVTSKKKKGRKKEKEEKKKETYDGHELSRNACVIQGLSTSLNDSHQLIASYITSTVKILVLVRKNSVKWYLQEKQKQF